MKNDTLYFNEGDSDVELIYEVNNMTACKICFKTVGKKVELCCGNAKYCFECLCKLVNIREATVQCPMCREIIELPIVYVNIEKQDDQVSQRQLVFPLTILLRCKKRSTISRLEEMKKCDYVFVDINKNLRALKDAVIAAENNCPLYIETDYNIPESLSEKCNKRKKTVDRKRRFEQWSKEQYLYSDLKDRL